MPPLDVAGEFIFTIFFLVKMEKNINLFPISYSVVAKRRIPIATSTGQKEVQGKFITMSTTPNSGKKEMFIQKKVPLHENSPNIHRKSACLICRTNFRLSPGNIPSLLKWLQHYLWPLGCYKLAFHLGPFSLIQYMLSRGKVTRPLSSFICNTPNNGTFNVCFSSAVALHCSELYCIMCCTGF